MMRILIADDHAIVRRGTRELLAEAFPGSEFVEAGTGEEAVARLDGKFDLVVIDLNMPGRGGLAALHALHERAPRLPLVVLSQHADVQYAIRSFKAGARGYVTKDRAVDELLEAVRAVRAGKKYVTPAIADQLVDAIADPSAPAHEVLSDRELQVLRLLGAGKALVDIAQELAISGKTASTYRRRILEKLKLSSTAELIRYAVKSGLSD